MKCADCSKSIEETFLQKPLGTHIRRDGKKVVICSACQRVAAKG